MKVPPIRMPKKFIFFTLALVVLGAGLWLGINYYSYLFSRHVTGVVDGVEKIEMSAALLTRGTAKDNPYLHSFAVAVRVASGEIVTASAEDRQWALVQKGQCVEARFYPYPPWQFDKSGTYFGARLLKLTNCEEGGSK